MRRIRVAGLLSLVALSIAGIGVAQTADAPVQLKDVTVAELPLGVTVSIETSGPPRYQATVIDSPARLVIDMNGSYAVSQTRWTATPDADQGDPRQPVEGRHGAARGRIDT